MRCEHGESCIENSLRENLKLRLVVFASYISQNQSQAPIRSGFVTRSFEELRLTCCKQTTAGGIFGGMVFTQCKRCSQYLFDFILTFPGLILGIAYTYSQDNKGKKVSFFIISFNVIWLPWAMLLMTLIMSSPEAALMQFTGLVAAHLYDFLTRLYPEFGGGKNYIQTPGFVKKRFAADRPGIQVRGYGTAFRPATPAPARGQWNGFGSSTWGARGQGRRLGGD